jgi:fluoride exporter
LKSNRDDRHRRGRQHEPIGVGQTSIVLLPRDRAIDLLAVWLGGALGTGARAVITSATPAAAIPVATFAINLVGAFALGLLFESLSRRGPGPRARLVRRLAGTGFLGGFTTYSALALDAVGLRQAGTDGLAAAYALGSVLLGTAAAGLGILLARGRSGRR